MRKQSILILIAICLFSSSCSTTSTPPPTLSYWPTQGWQASTPEAQGFDSAKLSEALWTIREEQKNVHSVIIIRNGMVILEAYFYPYDGKTVHELASVTKSVITTLIAIAADQGKLSLDDRMVSFFPDRVIANNSLLKRMITVRQLAGMTSGLDCSSANDEQTLTEMGMAPDWVQFTLDLKTRYIPGTHFEYCSPGMHLLSAILQEATGMTASEFARINLFEPLGITNTIWDLDPQGYNDGWAGLYMHPRDVAKLGLLMLQQGQWDEEQIVSSKWVQEATDTQTKTGNGDNYGFGWWVPPPTQQKEFAAVGRGGQYIRVLPELNLIAVTTGGGFDWNEVAPLFAPAIIDPTHPIQANPDGEEQLNATIASLLESPDPQPVLPLPETARLISGKIYKFDPNPLDIRTLTLEFGNQNEARLVATFSNQPDQDLLLGLDGIYRMYPIGDYGLPMGLRGIWLDDQIFRLEYDQIANRDAYTLDMKFEANHVIIQAKERTQDAIVTIKGNILNR